MSAAFIPPQPPHPYMLGPLKYKDFIGKINNM
jgi:hypothetical protein